MLLVSCSHDDDNAVIPPAGTAKTTQLQLSFGGASTYTTPATENEKKLGSIAIFVQVGTSETFSSHFTTKDQLINNIFTIDIQADNLSAAAQIIVIANYKENGISDSQLSLTHTLDDLQSFQTPAIANNGSMPGYPLNERPLLMYYTQSFENLQTYIETNGKITVNLKRMAARVDVIDNTETNTGLFGLYSAQVINPKSATYLLPNNTTTNIAAIMPLVDFLPVTTVTPTATDKRITLYTYECGESHLPTVQVVYQLISTGEKFMRDFPITTKESVPVASIKRNSYYEVYSTPPSVLILDPGDWDEEDEEWVAIP
ncbi:hypothetical protein [Dysgonomonas alginatilytica]|uniref:hypothetical protein n=1 Tax=Dysgonomonas alginatilytica TaxID=1605892 RepID=UPI0014766BEF|nr:hypothetical protein [Dysgonomonas alginatilytica]